MSNPDTRLAILFNRYQDQTCTSEERLELMTLLQDSANEQQVKQLISREADALVVPLGISDAYADEVLTYILSRHSGNASVHRIRFLKTPWFRYAAILLLIAGTATYLYITSPSFRRKPEVTATQIAPNSQNIQPGGNRALLTLSDGSVIVLDSAANGALATEGGMQVSKQGSGMLVYSAPRDPSGMTEKGGMTKKDPAYNTISTPKGGQYQVVLPDGSNVWLNAASSIRFPTIFGKDRRVEVTGEAYLEVTASASHPFVVHAGSTDIQVLGTSLNVNAYPNETATKTTLITGSIRVTSGSENVLLKAGQQAITNARGLQVVNTDISKAIAWKNGEFNFEGVGVAELMRQVERWYDVKVVYQSTVPTMKFAGTVKRNMSLTDLLEILGKTGVRYRTDANRTITIFP